MRKLIAFVALALCSLGAYAQKREVTDSGAFVIDASGRYVRLEGQDGVVVEYLYDIPDVDEASGLIVRANKQLTFTVRSARFGEMAVAGLPKLTSIFDALGNTRTVLADGVALARLHFTERGWLGSIVLPGQLTWKCSAPDVKHRVEQAVETPSGHVAATALVQTDFSTGVFRAASYDAVMKELGVNVDALTYDSSPTGALTTARDANGRVAFYLVHTDAGDVGFSPDGKPRFYDFKLEVYGGEVPPGSDILISTTFDGQRGTIPDHLVLTRSGAVGLYVEEPGNGAIHSAWTDSSGKLYTRATTQSPATSAVMRQPSGVLSNPAR